ncbi:protein TAPETUM DETERMINANT 1-like isoform X1 [Carya illinoinensis]|nr:protein TAPETUM DETERMINANT 1-like isoform X1 [Carya illinoinensis]
MSSLIARECLLRVSELLFNHGGLLEGNSGSSSCPSQLLPRQVFSYFLFLLLSRHLSRMTHSSFSRLQIITVALAASTILFFFGVVSMPVLLSGVRIRSSFLVMDGNNAVLTVPHRKLLLHRGMVEPNRIKGEKCTRSDIVVNQGPTPPLPSGIPTYTVEIMNVCVSGCDISSIHLSCGWFSSAQLINPKIFRRLGYNECLVNDGKPLANGRTLSFKYANTFPYPLSVSSVVCD